MLTLDSGPYPVGNRTIIQYMENVDMSFTPRKTNMSPENSAFLGDM